MAINIAAKLAAKPDKANTLFTVDLQKITTTTTTTTTFI